MHDLTLAIEADMPIFPGLPTFDAESHVSDETGALTHRITMSSHQGTHIDSPAHYISDGRTLEQIGLDELIGPVLVADLREHQGAMLDADLLETALPDLDPGASVALLTGDVDDNFDDPDFFEIASALTADAAEWLVEQDISLLLNDFLTERNDDPERPVHNTILGADIPMVEYLADTDPLAEVDRAELICLPLRLDGFEAAPIRVIAPEL